MSISFVAITGNVQNLIGSGALDFVLLATPVRPYYDSGTLIAQAPVKFVASTGGAITGSICQTETTQQLIAFSAHYTGGGIYQEVQYQPVIIPNVTSLDLSTLLVPLVNS